MLRQKRVSIIRKKMHFLYFLLSEFCSEGSQVCFFAACFPVSTFIFSFLCRFVSLCFFRFWAFKSHKNVVNFVRLGSHLWHGTGASKNKILKIRITIQQIQVLKMWFVFLGVGISESEIRKHGRMKTWREMFAFVRKLIDDGVNFQQLQTKSTNLRGKING